MSRVDERELSFASPFRARSLLTVRAAISFARLVERPCFFSASLMCSYWRSRLALHEDGISRTPYWMTTGLYPVARWLFQRWVLDVVLGRVLVREVVHDIEPFAVRVVDLD